MSTQTRTFCTRRPNTNTSFLNTSTQNKVRAIFQQYRYRSFQSTVPLMEESKSPEANNDDEIPEWQNPRHHNNPEKTKVMLDEFEDGEAALVALPPLDDGSGAVIAAPHLHDLADEIVGMSMLEVKELVDRVADHFGIEEGEDEDFAEAGPAAEEEVVEAKTAFDLKLTGFDAKSKIKVIKEVRAITGLGLKEAKEAVEGAPKTLKKDIKMEEAEELKAKLEAVGATVEID